MENTDVCKTGELVRTLPGMNNIEEDSTSSCTSSSVSITDSESVSSVSNSQDSTRHIRTRRELNLSKSLCRYEKRIRKFSASKFTELSNCFLSTFDCYSNILNDVPTTHHMCNHAVILMRIAREFGVTILGVTSERKNRDQYCVNLPAPHTRKKTRVIYVGKYNYFTKNVSSKWRMLPVDFVYDIVPTFVCRRSSRSNSKS